MAVSVIPNPSNLDNFGIESCMLIRFFRKCSPNVWGFVGYRLNCLKWVESKGLGWRIVRSPIVNRRSSMDYVVKPVVGHGLIEALQRIYKRLTELRAKLVNFNLGLRIQFDGFFHADNPSTLDNPESNCRHLLTHTAS